MIVYKKLPKCNVTYVCLFNMYLVKVHFYQYNYVFNINGSLFTFNDRS